MPDNPVTVGSFQFAPEAEVARMCLAEEGIRAFIIDGEIVTADWFLGNAVGYIKLQVAESQAEAALAVLQRVKVRRSRDGQDEEDCDADELDNAVCLACGADLSESPTTCGACGWSYGGAGDAVAGELLNSEPLDVEQTAAPEQDFAGEIETANALGAPDRPGRIGADGSKDSQPRFCIVCGAIIEMDLAVCPGCGSSLGEPLRDDRDSDPDDESEEFDHISGMDRLRSLKRPFILLWVWMVAILIGGFVIGPMLSSPFHLIYMVLHLVSRRSLC